MSNMINVAGVVTNARVDGSFIMGGSIFMRVRHVVSGSVICGFLMGLSMGCGESTEVKLAPAPAVKPLESQPLPKDPKKGGGPGSSGNSSKSPGAST
jgi:hypothetical protein